MQRLGRAWIVLAAVATLKMAACSSEGSAGGAGGTTGTVLSGAGGGATSGAAGTAGTGGTMDVCQSEKAELAPLALFVLLDASAAMQAAPTPVTTKWGSVTDALRAFFRDPASVGMSVGLGYFPIELEGVPDTCMNDAACGQGAPCISKICLNVLVETNEMLPCLADNDCDRGTQFPPTCRTIGECSSEPGTFCFTESASSCDGTCTQAGICSRFVACDPSRYDTAAVAISELPMVEPALSSSLQARTPKEAASTPPALSGAIQHALAFAETHADHDVLTVLVTGGMPTECTARADATVADAASELAAIARNGASGGVRTYVIGVFDTEHLAEARTHLNGVAEAGGSERSFVVDAAGDIARDVQSALNQIRTSERGCAFRAPSKSQGGATIDYDDVQVELTAGAATTRIPRVRDRASCAATGGWYYDADPSVVAPKRIIACPLTCDALQSQSGSVRVAVACE